MDVLFVGSLMAAQGILYLVAFFYILKKECKKSEMEGIVYGAHSVLDFIMYIDDEALTNLIKKLEEKENEKQD